MSSRKSLAVEAIVLAIDADVIDLQRRRDGVEVNSVLISAHGPPPKAGACTIWHDPGSPLDSFFAEFTLLTRRLTAGEAIGLLLSEGVCTHQDIAK